MPFRRVCTGIVTIANRSWTERLLNCLVTPIKRMNYKYLARMMLTSVAEAERFLLMTALYGTVRELQRPLFAG